MREAIMLQARYNQFANQKMAAVLRNLTISQFEKDFGVYYKSIKGLLVHQLEAEIALVLGFINNQVPNKIDVSELESAQKSILANKNLDELLRILEQSSAKVIELVSRVPDFGKNAVLEFPGIKFEHSIGHYFLALLNHCAHHRGQISACLDILNIDNDFAGMLGM